MATETRSTRDARIAFRASARQEQIIKAAAAASDKTMTDFVLDTAVQHAEKILADRRYFLVDEAQWAAVERILEQPMPALPKLSALLRADDVFAD